ncbi:MAG: GAF domain-containing sensor histidine kinase [Cyanobacteria bacterium Co-bin8]|nr:GAF domain-containing sensor histidine kinase [Cyanobacteria bacterium Co-bin8]
MDPLSSYSTSLDAADKYSEIRLYCHLEGAAPAERTTLRLQALKTLGLLEPGNIPVFEEAAQMAARFLNLSICTLSVATESAELFKAAVGLSQLGMMNPLAKSRQLSLTESFGVNVLDSEQPCVLPNAAEHVAFTDYQLVQNYGVRAYAGVPLVTSQGCCIGILAVMDCQPHAFTQKDIAFLELTARWAISEYERTYWQTQLPVAANSQPPAPSPSNPGEPGLRVLIDSVRLNLITQLAQELRSPLTSVVGMASMLSREIYGPLTDKQREYTQIVCSSSQRLMALVDEIVELGAFDENYQQLVPTSVDIEMLGQQVLKTLEQITEKRQQRLSLTIEPGPRVWALDKSKVKQLLYHLMFSVIQMSGESSIVRLHASRRGERLNLAVWLSNPWLGEGLPQPLVNLGNLFLGQPHNPLTGLETLNYLANKGEEAFFTDAEMPDQGTDLPQYSRELLGLLLSRHLTELHGGTIAVQGTAESGHRFVVSLPSLVSASRLVEFSS